ncbi:MAG: SET domain-containing protein-lysine N-methyltransferase [Chlamydiia bacterium]|nr:SET domain-containing protein-lysine N-methyltransferase [Chlamydiia bacterium]
MSSLLDAWKKGEWGLDAQTKEGNTLLHFAVIEDHPGLVEQLLQKNAKILPNQWGLTPAHLTQLLNRLNPLRPQEERSILIYRNRDEKIHPMPLKEFEERLEITYTDSLIFDSIKTIHQVAKKCARKMQKKELRQMNHWTLCLHKSHMGLPREDLYYIRWINRYLGYGVFAAKPIPANTYIGEYTGIIKRRNNRKNRFNDYVFSYDLCGKATRWCIDAKHTGNFTRFLNHSDTPNLTSRWVIKDGITHIILFSNRFIPQGAQMTYCYGPWYWRSRSAPAPL